METPVTTQETSCNRYNLIKLLFGKQDDLLRFFFNNEKTGLNFADARTTLRIAGAHFEEGANTLIRIALDIWLGTSRTRAMEIPDYLTVWGIENVMMVFAVMTTVPRCGCQNCKQRFAESETR